MKRATRKVEAIDPATGQVVHIFDTLADAERANYHRQSIFEVLQGKRQTHRGLFWREAAEPVGDVSTLSAVTIDELRKAAAILNRILAEYQPPADDLLQQFIAASCKVVPGAAIEFVAFWSQFVVWLKEQGHDSPGKMAVVRAVSAQFPYGIRYGGRRYIGNVAWKWETVAASRPWTASGGRITRAG